MEYSLMIIYAGRTNDSSAGVAVTSKTVSFPDRAVADRAHTAIVQQTQSAPGHVSFQEKVTVLKLYGPVPVQSHPIRVEGDPA